MILVCYWTGIKKRLASIRRILDLCTRPIPAVIRPPDIAALAKRELASVNPVSRDLLEPSIFLLACDPNCTACLHELFD